jgi:hypothetical protein
MGQQPPRDVASQDKAKETQQPPLPMFAPDKIKSRAWTLALLVAGLAIGCLNAWHWVAKEDNEMRDELEDDDE